MFKPSVLMYSNSVAFTSQGLRIEIQNYRYREFLATGFHLAVIVWGFRNSKESFGCLWGFRILKTSLGGFGIPKFGKVFGQS